MGLFSGLFKGASNSDGGSSSRDVVLAPVAGTVVSLEEVPDQVFSTGMLGKGCGIEPTDGVLVAPVAGTLTALFPTLHAVGVSGDDGVEVLVHIGVDTVEMGGDGFAAFAAKGDHVEAGQKLVSFDREKIAAAGHPDTVMVVISNTSEFSDVDVLAKGAVAAGDQLVRVSR